MSKFKEKVLEVVNIVPEGRVVSYGQVALMAGIPRAAQAVGQILHGFGEETLWWRVINNAGRISTKCLEHPAHMQKALLENEGIKVTDKLGIDIEKYRFRPEPKLLEALELDDEYISVFVEKYLW